MRIIKAAKQVEEYITTCECCKSIIGVNPSDLDWSCGAWTYICPVCSESNDLRKPKEVLFPWKMEDEDGREVPSNNVVREY